MDKYIYGMKLRGSGSGCQPDGLVEVLDSNDFKWLLKTYNYWDLIAYDRQLNEKEIEDYELEFVAQTTEDLNNDEVE